VLRVCCCYCRARSRSQAVSSLCGYSLKSSYLSRQQCQVQPLCRFGCHRCRRQTRHPGGFEVPHSRPQRESRATRKPVRPLSRRGAAWPPSTFHRRRWPSALLDRWLRSMLTPSQSKALHRDETCKVAAYHSSAQHRTSQSNPAASKETTLDGSSPLSYRSSIRTAVVG
jgi:hypothetical protein